MAKIDIEKLAVVYARFSSHAQGEQSIEGQLSEAKKYADANGYTIIHEYVDRAKTGRNDNREQFQKMLSDVSKKQFSTIIVWKVDRFGRNREEITLNKYHCKKYGVQVKYVAEVIPDTAEGVILESVLEGFAEYYSLQLSQNVKRGMYESAMKCRATGGSRLLGYRTNENHEFIIDEQEALIVKKIFQLYLDGNTIREIVDCLNSQGHKSAKNKAFTYNGIFTILSNRKYIGIYSYKDIEIPDGIPRIIDDETFYKAQEIKMNNKRTSAKKTAKTEYLLTGKLFCGKCGESMQGESGHSKCGTIHHYYTCRNRKKYKTCDKKPVKKDLIEKIVFDYAKEILFNDELLEFIINNCWEICEKQNDTSAEINRVNSQIAEIDKAICNLLDILQKGVVSDSLTDRLQKLEQEKTDLQAYLAEIQNSKPYHLSRQTIAYMLYGFRKLDFENPKAQKRLIDAFVNSVYVFDDSVIINFNYSGDKSKITHEQVTSVDADFIGDCEYSTFDCFSPPKKCTPILGVHFFAMGHRDSKPRVKKNVRWTFFTEER